MIFFYVILAFTFSLYTVEIGCSIQCGDVGGVFPQ